MLHELVLMMAINIQSHMKKSMIIREYLFKWQIKKQRHLHHDTHEASV